MPLSIATGDGSHAPILARLYTITWDDAPAMALIFAADAPGTTEQTSGPQRVAETAAPAQQSLSPAVNDDLAFIIEAMADGIVMFDQEGNILSCNRSAEALFNEAATRLTQCNLADLFAPESQSVVLAYFEGLDDPAVTGPMDHGREVLGQVRGGGLIPLAMTMGRTADARYFAVFRDLSQLKKNEADLLSARRSAERAAALRTDVLAKINHEIRIPLNAIIGFAEAMIEQRFGPLGAERYLDYMRDIRAAGERVLDDRRRHAQPDPDRDRQARPRADQRQPQQSRRAMRRHAAAAGQPRAHHHPLVARAASARRFRRCAIAAADRDQPDPSSIELANAGRRIVSTALTDRGDVALRVRDTGRALSERDIKAAVEPYHASAGDDHVVPDTGESICLRKRWRKPTARNSPFATRRSGYLDRGGVSARDASRGGRRVGATIFGEPEEYIIRSFLRPVVVH